MRYKKILLISPRFFKGRFRLAIHPLAGLGYIAESLRANGFAVSVFDMNLGYDHRDLERRISGFRPDIIGFTVMTFGHRDLYALVERIKAAHPGIKIMAGGPHISTLRGKVLEDCPAVDYGIILEGEQSVVELCMGADPDKIQGLVHRRGGEIAVNDFRNFIADLDKLHFPKYELFELNKYPTGQIGIVTSRGCPYECIYCPVNSAIGRQYRQRSAQGIVDEIEYWHKKGRREILMLDDNFTLSRKRVEEICGLLSRKAFKGISLKCPNGVRADKVDYDLLKMMREAGFDMLSFGVEAASDRVLKTIKKGEDASTIEKGIRDACSLGFDVDLFFLIGSPGENLKDVESSFSLARRYPVRSAKFYNIVPFPGTELFGWIGDNGYFLRAAEDIINNASHFINEPCFFTPEMSAGDRKWAFEMGQKISREIRRKFIERKLKGPSFLRKAFSRIYTSPLAEAAVNNNAMVIRLKEGIRRGAGLWQN